MKNNFEILVQKYGGSSVANPQKIIAVANFIKNKLSPTRKACIVVSAMGHTTNDLLALASSISKNPPKREMDMLISCGERSSMALLAMALNEIGVRALSLTGSQSGIITTSDHQNAEVKSIRPGRVLQAFDHHQVVIVAGFQGVSETKEITTLKRGGSDTTAVAMAAALNASCCEIFSDVPGVMEADPRIVKRALVIPQLNFKQMNSMSLYGAKILAHDAIELATTLGVKLGVRQSCDESPGTTICNYELDASHKELISLSHLRAIVRVEIPLTQISSSLATDGYLLCASLQKDRLVGYVSNDISQEYQNMSKAKLRGGLGLITLHLSSNRWSSRTLATLVRLFLEHELEIIDMTINGYEIHIIILDALLENALNIIHDGFLIAGRDT